MVRSPDSDTIFYDIVAGVLRGDISSRYIFIIYLDFLQKSSVDIMKENGFMLK